MFLQNLINYFNSIVNECKLNDDSNIEFEIKIMLDPRINIPSYISKSKHIDKNVSLNSRINDSIQNIKSIIANASPRGNVSMSQTINFIKTYKTEMFVKQLVFINGIQAKDKKKLYTKKSLITPVYLVSDEVSTPLYKLSINEEIDKSDDTNQFDIVRFRLRYSITFTDELKDWRLDLTLIKETNNQSIQYLKQLRNVIFTPDINSKNFIDSDIWYNVDRVELELEYVGSQIQLNKIAQLDTLWGHIQTKHRTYKDCVCQIAQIIKPKSLDKFKSGYFGLKQLGSNPVELTKKSYNVNVLSNIDNYILTEKINGLRSMLLIYPQKGECHIINTVYSCKKIDVCPNNPIKLIILDAEEYIENGKNVYYVFDIIWYNKNISNYAFCSHSNDRMGYIKKTVDQYDFLKSKHFIYLNQLDYEHQIKDFYDFIQLLPYETDGFIFISKDFNYADTLNFKWKPPEKSTIDFVAKKCPLCLLGIKPYIKKDNTTLYLLFVGIRVNEYNKLGVVKIKNYDTMFKKINYKDKYIPIQFSPSSDPYAYLFWSENDNLDNCIVELNRKDNLWNLVKVRDDRKNDMDRKTYYGNYFKYAEYIWMNYKNPLLVKNLCSSIKQEYFKVDDNIIYKFIRKFNNFVKDHIIKSYKQQNTNWVIDLAAGKGQDLFKYIECNISNILMIDNDLSALSEIINRKYDYINNNKIKSLSKIFIKHLNLIDLYKKNITELTKSRFAIPISGVQLIVCNFALHYLTPNNKKMQNFVNLVHKLLKPGGIFTYTSFDGERIHKLLEDNDGLWDRTYNNKPLYSIKRKYDNEFTGENQQIDVLLPFSDGQYYTEYLINNNLLIKMFKKKKITLIKSDSFTTYLDLFKDRKPHFHKELKKIDMEFLGFYNYYVFKNK